MRTLTLPPDLAACLNWLRAVNGQSWQAPAPPPLPPRPTGDDKEAQGFYDFMAPIYSKTVGVWTSLASYRAAAAAPAPSQYDLSYQANVSAP